MKLRYERSALANLDEIVEHIATDNPDAARRFLARIDEVARLIAALPFVGQKTRNPKVRRFPVGKYLIAYEVGDDEVIIQYVRHGARLRPWEGEK